MEILLLFLIVIFIIFIFPTVIFWKKRKIIGLIIFSFMEVSLLIFTVMDIVVTVEGSNTTRKLINFAFHAPVVETYYKEEADFISNLPTLTEITNFKYHGDSLDVEYELNGTTQRLTNITNVRHIERPIIDMLIKSNRRIKFDHISFVVPKVPRGDGKIETPLCIRESLHQNHADCDIFKNKPLEYDNGVYVDYKNKVVYEVSENKNKNQQIYPLY